MTDRAAPLLAPRPNEDEGEQRFREALDRLGSQLIQTMDAAIGMRTASADTQRSRHIARGDLQAALLRIQHTYHLSRATGPMKQKPRSA